MVSPFLSQECSYDIESTGSAWLFEMGQLAYSLKCVQRLVDILALMFTLRRWWEKNALKAGLICLAVGTAWGIRQTNGTFIYETYQLIARPFPGGPST
ncbi:MAG: hypothetical protein ACR2FS_05290, partial [Phormidesmis sp.]